MTDLQQQALTEALASYERLVNEIESAHGDITWLKRVEEDLRKRMARLKALPDRGWNPGDADSVTAVIARSYNAGLRDARAALSEPFED